MTADPIQAAMVALNEAIAERDMDNCFAFKAHAADCICTLCTHIDALRKHYNEACIHYGPEEA